MLKLLKNIDLENIKKEFLSARNIQEKRKLAPILEKISNLGYNPFITQKSLGEDSAIIPGNEDSTDHSDIKFLLTTDAILPSFIRKSPFGAGFSSIYVGIDDIIACGGTPTACSTIVSFPNSEIGDQIIEGITKGTQRFKIPLIRGHTTTDADDVFLASTVVGICPSEGYISAKGAKIGDFVALVWDMEGKPAKANRMYWDTITNKTSEIFYQKRAFFPVLARKGFLHASKDVSNGGLLGTLYQMMEYSTAKIGIHVDITSLSNLIENKTVPYSLEEFLFVFLTSAFLISGDQQNIKEISDNVNQCGMEFTLLGNFIEERVLRLQLHENHIDLVKIGDKL